MAQTAAMLIDAFEPEGITELAKDSIFMMPHLGVLASVHPQAALEVFEKDCLISLGTCIAPKGQGKPGKPCFRYRIDGPNLQETGELMCGDVRLFPLSESQTARVVLEPSRGFRRWCRTETASRTRRQGRQRRADPRCPRTTTLAAQTIRSDRRHTMQAVLRESSALLTGRRSSRG